MALHQYEVCFSSLSADKRADLIERIENFSFNGLHWKQGFQSAVFFIDETSDVSFLNVPAACRLTRVH